jgi:transposase
MSTNDFTLIGIDISKDKFDLCLFDKVVRFKNNDKGFKDLTQKLPNDSWCVMESTSTYGYRLADYLVAKGFKVSIVNPLSIKRFAQMNLSRTKTDKADAKLITEYAKIAKLPIYQPSSNEMNELQQLETVLEQLIKQRTALINQLEALNQMPRICKSANDILKKLIDEISNEIKAIETLMRYNADKDCPGAYEMALSVVGIGHRTATLLLAITRGFTMFDNAKQLSAYVGVCPRTLQSGKSIKGKSHICKIGLSNVRAILYMCSQSAAKFNIPCKELYNRLISKGKPKKVALMAVVNKLIHQVFACVSKNEKFEKNYKVSFGI